MYVEGKHTIEHHAQGIATLEERRRLRRGRERERERERRRKTHGRNTP